MKEEKTPGGYHRTPKQKAALRAGYKVLTENFDDVLIVCSTRADHEGRATDLDVYWQGSWLMANALADFAKDTIKHRKRNKSEPS